MKSWLIEKDGKETQRNSIVSRKSVENEFMS